MDVKAKGGSKDSGALSQAEEAALLKVLKGLSCRDYESCVDSTAATFGLAPSSLSRRFKRASAKKLAELTERDLSAYDLVALFLDGKTFGDELMVIALGVTLEGQKVVLGFVQTSTENQRSCSAHLRQGQDGTVAHSFGAEPAERFGRGQFDRGAGTEFDACDCSAFAFYSCSLEMPPCTRE